MFASIEKEEMDEEVREETNLQYSGSMDDVPYTVGVRRRTGYTIAAYSANFARLETIHYIRWSSDFHIFLPLQSIIANEIFIYSRLLCLLINIIINSINNKLSSMVRLNNVSSYLIVGTSFYRIYQQTLIRIYAITENSFSSSTKRMFYLAGIEN